jgi:hypothetical protein
MSRQALDPTLPLIQWILEALFPGLKWLGCEANHSPPCNAKVRNSWSCTFNTPYVFIVRHLIRKGYASMAWYLVKHRDNFTFTFSTINALSLITLNTGNSFEIHTHCYCC